MSRIVSRILFLSLLALTACGSLIAAPTEDAAVTDVPDASDGPSDARRTLDAGALNPGTDADARTDAPDAECASSVYSQIFCYGTSHPDAGTSHTYPTDCDTSACHLMLDDAGANPPVWCCP